MYNICILNISIGDRKHSRGNNASCCLKPMLIGVIPRFLSSAIMQHDNRVVGSTWQLGQGTKQYNNNSSCIPND